MDGNIIIDVNAVFDLVNYNLTNTSGNTFTNNGTFQLDGDQTTDTPTNNSGSIVEYTATSGTRDIKNWTYQTLKINGGGGTFTMGVGETLSEDLRVDSGTFDVNDQILSINGDTFICGGIMMTGTNTFTFGDASVPVLITG